MPLNEALKQRGSIEDPSLTWEFLGMAHPVIYRGETNNGNIYVDL
jgi:hypothetical protein